MGEEKLRGTAHSIWFENSMGFQIWQLWCQTWVPSECYVEGPVSLSDSKYCILALVLENGAESRMKSVKILVQHVDTENAH